MLPLFKGLALQDLYYQANLSVTERQPWPRDQELCHPMEISVDVLTQGLPRHSSDRKLVGSHGNQAE